MTSSSSSPSPVRISLSFFAPPDERAGPAVHVDGSPTRECQVLLPRSIVLSRPCYAKDVAAWCTGRPHDQTSLESRSPSFWSCPRNLVKIWTVFYSAIFRYKVIINRFCSWIFLWNGVQYFLSGTKSGILFKQENVVLKVLCDVTREYFLKYKCFISEKEK